MLIGAQRLAAVDVREGAHHPQFGKELARWSGHKRAVTCVAVSADGQRALSGSSDRTVRLWDVASGEELAAFAGPASLINGVAFAPNGRRFAAVEEDGQLWLWQSED